MDIASDIILIGIGATAFTDLWTLARQRLFGVAMPDYGLVGRWIGHMPGGRFRHTAIKAAAQVRGERLIGWGAHYVIGIAFAGLLAGFAGPAWFAQPRPGPALIVGIATVAAPWLLMQPGMGAGLAARLSPTPWAMRLHSFITHLMFGVGLYVAAQALVIVQSR